MKKLPLKIGVTGGIGSGKTRVCTLFEYLGFRVFYADKEARQLMHSDPDLIDSVKNLLGKEAYTEDGALNRAWVGAKVFNDPQLLAALNGLVHPATRRHFERWYQEESATYGQPFLLYEAAILYEGGGERQVDGVLTVYAPKALRIKRVCDRDNVKEQQVLDRMGNQWPDAQKVAKADFVIYNDGAHHLIPQVLEGAKFFAKLRT